MGYTDCHDIHLLSDPEVQRHEIKYIPPFYDRDSAVSLITSSSRQFNETLEGVREHVDEEGGNAVLSLSGFFRFEDSPLINYAVKFYGVGAQVFESLKEGDFFKFEKSTLVGRFFRKGD